MSLIVRVVAALLVACFFLSEPAFSQTGNASTDRANGVQRRVEELIEQLAAPEYLARRSAQIELEEIGLPAFDQVLSATKSPDPEVASASQYLLSKLAVRWAEPDDPPEIRPWMKVYGASNEQERRRTVERIKRLWERGVGPAANVLCRIVRFDLSPGVSSFAASVLLDGDEQSVPVDRAASIRAGLSRLDARYGGSRRAAWRWLEQFARQGELPPREALRAWDALAFETTEDGASDNGAPDDDALDEFDAAGLAAVEWNRLRLQLASDADGAVRAVGRLVELADRRPGLGGDQAVLRRVFRWLRESGADRLIDTVAEQHADALATKPGGYLLASVRWGQGQEEEARRLAAVALATPHAEAEPLRAGGVLDGRIAIAAWLREQQHLDWAHAEYRAVIADTPELSPSAVLSQQALATSLHDAADYAEAADVLESLVTQVNANATSKRRYAQLAQPLSGRLVAGSALESRRLFNRALAHRAAGEEASARQLLDDALKSNPADADILIAMYRSPGADAGYRRGVMRRVRDLAVAYEKEVEEKPGQPVPLNQWAWLISNTEGDYERAIEFSRRSLQLAPGDGGFLDTLGRCCFAAGRFEEAVRVQRLAVEQLPHQQVMQRQLAEFEAALAEAAPTEVQRVRQKGEGG